MSMRFVFEYLSAQPAQILKKATLSSGEGILQDINVGAIYALAAKLQDPNLSNQKVVLMACGVSALSFGISFLKNLYHEMLNEFDNANYAEHKIGQQDSAKEEVLLLLNSVDLSENQLRSLGCIR